MSDVLVIAEAGVNHNGDVGMAIDLIDAARAAGADIVKFQTFSADKLTTRSARSAAYQRRNTGQEQSQNEMLKRLELDARAHRRLQGHCRRRGIRFLSTAFDMDSLDFLHRMDLGLYKVPSGEITNLPYLRRIASFRAPVLLSTGMSTLADVDAAVRALLDGGLDRKRITLLQCNTEYPTPFRDVNLRAMVSMGRSFGVAYGYSDHTAGIEVPVAAVALGATVIEKHFTLDRNLPGPDHRASLEPAELTAMISAIRNVERALGDGIKRPSRSESKNTAVARKSIVAAVAIRKGEPFTSRNITVKRPGTGLSPMEWDKVIGRRAVRAFAPDDIIEL